jgi:hypothetical protein
MVFYFSMLVVLLAGYYTFTYGLHLWRYEHEKLAGFGVIFIALVSTLFPIVLLFVRR